ncbi:MAG: hypothetical protein H7Z16_17555 [Pyrinomonadaceae bacterium]|nr:hypothetical protein [Pyrinomonadaceae bacterium]
MRSRFALIVLIVFASLTWLTQTVSACSCMGPGPPCQAYWTTSAVFTGEVIEITSTTIDDEHLRGYPQKLVRFAVSESFRGASGRLIEAITGNGGGDCGYPFKVGNSYLVYAYRNPKDNRLYAGICSRTRPLPEAGEDLEYIRNLAKAEAGATISGVVNRYQRVKADVSYQPLAPASGIRVIVEGNGRSVESVTDSSGQYRVTGLPSGKYKVRLTVPDGLWIYAAERGIEVQDKGCAVVGFTLETNTSLSGKVIDENGEPAAKIRVDLVPPDQINQRYQRNHLSAYTDEKGRFVFRSIPPANYLLGIRLSRLAEPTFAYPRTFHPGTSDPTQAAVIAITEGQTLEGYDLQLPGKLDPRTIEGSVVWPDGKPVPNANLCFEEVEHAEGSSCHAGDAKVTPDGHFSLTVLEGLRYLLRAHVNVGGPGSGQRHAEPIEVSPKGNISDIKLVITEPNGSCAKCRDWTRQKKP